MIAATEDEWAGHSPTSPLAPVQLQLARSSNLCEYQWSESGLPIKQIVKLSEKRIVGWNK